MIKMIRMKLEGTSKDRKNYHVMNVKIETSYVLDVFSKTTPKMFKRLS